MKKHLARTGDKMNDIEEIRNLIGQPSSEQTKPLFEIVENLNKEILELRLELSNLKSKVGIYNGHS